MKITAKKYAESLLLASEGKSEKEVKTVVSNLLSILAENKDLKLVDSVILHFEKLWNIEHDIREVTVTTAKKMDVATKKHVKKFISEKLGVKSVELDEQIDESVLGGVVIKEGDKVYDGCVRTRLYSFKEEIVN